MDRVEAGLNELYTDTEGNTCCVLEILGGIVGLTLGELIQELYSLLNIGLTYNQSISTVLREENVKK